MRQLSKNYCREGGFALVSVIVAILIFSILGAALVKILSSSTFSQVGSNSSMRAYYLAEGGYRYAGSQFLHAGTGIARDDMLSTLNNTTYTMANNFGSFLLQSYPWFYKSIAADSSVTSLKTQINGDKSPDLTIPTSGKISVGGIVYSYTNSVTSGSTVTFTISPALPAVPADKTTVLPVAESAASAQTLSNGGNLTLASGASSFPPFRGTFKIEGNNTAYAYQSLSNNNTLNNITDFSNSAATFSVPVPASKNVTLLKYLELHSTGTVGSGSMLTNRMVNYRGPISSVPSDQSGGESNVISDTFDNTNNSWVAAPGVAAIDTSPKVPGGGSALEITKTPGGGEYAVVTSNIISDKLKGLWSLSKGLSYDEQVKVATNINVGYAGGISFRRHPVGTVNQGFGLSFVYLKNYNDPDIDAYADNSATESSANKTSNSCWKKNANCILAADNPTHHPYLVLWKYTSDDPSSFKTIAYYELPSAMYPLPDWSTLMVRIKEKPSGSTNCTGTFATSIVNEIQVYYSTTNGTVNGNITPTDDPLIAGMRLGNTRGSVNWPPDTGGTTLQNDYFTLVSWSGDKTTCTGVGRGPGCITGNYQFADTVEADGPKTNTIICTTENLTNAYSSTSFPSEVALTAMGQTTQQHIWFDDFAIGSGPGGGVTTIGFLPPIQQ